ncbi:MULTISPECIES: hypothetical protein [Nostocales]|uniref:Uncharacterized protein n=3 Tax=Nostocales TaxID=1161 RepID=A0A8S9TCV4_9CYAN|nr:hypothetical protein [Tolypothrix bouteillei]KAF3889279.1 hypothetical protein DA73_0400030195 [Tolypothrix bouteillei VB521301]
MAPSKYLERGDWRGVLCRSFEGAIRSVQLAPGDRFMTNGSISPNL